eukprot:COSAG04_NODE_1574_length_6276_cov_3.068480_3_plen_567_part_00
MELMVFVLLYTSAIGGCGYIFLVGDPDGTGLIDRLNRFITRDVIEALRWALFKTIGSRGVAAYDAFEEYLCWSANPLLQIFYLAMILGGFGGFILAALPFVACHPLLPCLPAERPEGTTELLAPWHRITAYATMTTCLASWVLCCVSDPGCVTAGAQRAVYCYEWDGFVHSKKVCPTTRLMRPARSTYAPLPSPPPSLTLTLRRARRSYCRYTGRLVLRFDHFCPWIKNAVGENNYRYFFAFLGMHWFTLGYASWGCGWMLLSRLEEENFWSRENGLAQIYDPETGDPRSITWGEVLRVCLMLENKVMLLGLFCFFLAIVVFAFWGYHAYLTATNMTTNESIKRGRVRNKIQAAIENEDAMLLEQIATMGAAAAAGVVEGDEGAARKAASGGLRKRGKGKAKAGKGPTEAAGPSSAPMFGTRKQPSEFGCVEKLDAVVMQVGVVGRLGIGVASGTAVGGFLGGAMGLQLLWVGVSAMLVGGAAAGCVGFLPVLLGWGRPRIHMPNPYDRGVLGNIAEVLWPRSQRAGMEAVAGAPETVEVVPLPAEVKASKVEATVVSEAEAAVDK